MGKNYKVNVTHVNEYYDYINDYLIKNPYMFLAIALVFLFFFIFMRYLGQHNTSVDIYDNESPSLKIIKFIVFIIILILIVVTVLKYFLDINVDVLLKNVFKETPEVDINILKKKEEPDNSFIDNEERQVFNIPDNIYNYDDAKALCKAFNAELATYNQIEDAYSKGGEWCNYGWSSDQMILYPTQKETYNKLKSMKGHEHDCGRPGINGGYIANPQAKFGVNCYGVKPKINHREKKMMKNAAIFPEDKENRCERKKIKNFRKYLKKIIISPFNKTEWNG